MASAKENLRKNSKKLLGHGYNTDQFRTTKILKEIIRELKETLHCASTSSSSNPKLFNGEEMADVLATILAANRERFGFKEAKKENAIKLCEQLLKDGIFVAAKDNKFKTTFEPLKNAFYYFGEDRFMGLSLLSIKENADHLVPSPLRNSTSTLNTVYSVSSVENTGDMDDKFFREFALSRLLILVDVEILEGVLHNEGGSLFKSMDSLLFGIKSAFNRSSRSSSIEDYLPTGTADRFTVVACRCLQCCHIPIDWQSIKSQSLFNSVIDGFRMYTTKNGPIIPQQYEIFIPEILRLVQLKETNGKALEACQLLFLLLSSGSRDRMGALLDFLIVCSEHRFVDLQKVDTSFQISDIEFKVTLSTFTDFILPTNSMDEGDGRMMNFFLVNSQVLLSFPKTFRQQYKQAILERNSVKPKCDLTFCHRISTDEFNTQKLSATQQALFDQLSIVIESDRMNDEQKRTFFKKFKIDYPEIYEARFPSA